MCSESFAVASVEGRVAMEMLDAAPAAPKRNHAFKVSQCRRTASRSTSQHDSKEGGGVFFLGVLCRVCFASAAVDVLCSCQNGGGACGIADA